MAILVSLSIYLVFISTILLGFRTASLLACPLPDTATCGQCHVLNYINSLSNSQSKINLTINLDLSKSINRAIEFTQPISSGNNLDYDFQPYGPAGCSSNDTPCTQSIHMAGSNLPNCSWNYTCDYSPNRFPQYIWMANCASAPPGYRPQEIYYLIPTLVIEDGCLPFQRADVVYKWVQKRVPVACTCIATE